MTSYPEVGELRQEIESMQSTIADLTGEALGQKTLLNGLRFLRSDIERKALLIEAALSTLQEEVNLVTRRIERLEAQYNIL